MRSRTTSGSDGGSVGAVGSVSCKSLDIAVGGASVLAGGGEWCGLVGRGDCSALGSACAGKIDVLVLAVRWE